MTDGWQWKFGIQQSFVLNAIIFEKIAIFSTQMFQSKVLFWLTQAPNTSNYYT